MSYPLKQIIFQLNVPVTPGLSYISTYVNDIYTSCKDPNGQQTGGQEFDDNGYNVIVRNDNCQDAFVNGQ
jgi:hypothetical protein